VADAPPGLCGGGVGLQMDIAQAVLVIGGFGAMVGFSEVFEQQVPSFRGRIPVSVETAWKDARRHHPRYLGVELDFPLPRVKQTADTVGQASLEDQGSRSLYRLVVGDRQADNARE